MSADGFDSKAAEYASKALELDPKLVEAHELLANLALEDADTNMPSRRRMRRCDCRPTRWMRWRSMLRLSCWRTAPRMCGWTRLRR